MSPTAFTLPVAYLRQVVATVGGDGENSAAWLATVGLSVAALEDPLLTVNLEQFSRFVAAALEASQEPALGLFVGRRLVAQSHGMLGYAALSAGTVREALGLFGAFTRLRTSLVQVAVTAEPSGGVRVAVVPTEPLGAIERPVLEAILLSVANVLATISLGACRVASVAFPWAIPGEADREWAGGRERTGARERTGPSRDYAALAREFFGAPVTFDAGWAGLVVPEEGLDRPLALADPEAFAEAARICERELAKLTADDTLAGKVRRILLENQEGFPPFPVIARRLHRTPRTLHRHLVAEGTSFRAVLEDVRHRLAVEQVASGRFGLEEIAYRLGYSELANFRRAFKRWEKVPPSAFRSRTLPKLK